jgi:hypothetical protein
VYRLRRLLKLLKFNHHHLARLKFGFGNAVIGAGTVISMYGLTVIGLNVLVTHRLGSPRIGNRIHRAAMSSSKELGDKAAV